MIKKIKFYFNWRQYSLLIIAIVLLVISALPSSGPSIEDLLAVDYTPLSGDDWEVSTPAEQGLDPLLVAELYYNAAELETLYSLLVVKNGYLIAEDYFHEGSVDQKDRLQSVTKSYTSALVGIALQQGYLSSVDQKMLDFLPEVADQITDPRKEQITIRDLLQMRAGYPSEETDPILWDGLLSGYYLPLIEEFPLIADPGIESHYSNLSSNWLGIIVDLATGMNLKAYAEQNLFLPLDVEAGEWGTDAEGHNNGCGDLHLRARDAAKFGLLYLNDGEYEGNQVIPADWVHDSLQTYTEDINVTGGFPANWGLSVSDIGYGAISGGLRGQASIISTLRGDMEGSSFFCWMNSTWLLSLRLTRFGCNMMPSHGSTNRRTSIWRASSSNPCQVGDGQGRATFRLAKRY
jgi:CubicO group peptidase (beta-lactamase class C family)